MSDLLAAKTVLVVAKKLDDISQLRSIASGLGASEVSVASSANMAVSILRHRAYDLVIADDELGEGEKTGLQVIEEASREGVRRCVDIYVLVVDKEIKTLPRDSIFNGPDTFIPKPINGAKVAQRLERLLKLKHAVSPVESLVDQGDLDKALKVIPLLTSRYPSLELYLERVKGRILLAKQDYAAAVSHFLSIAQTRNIDWAFLGAGIAEYHLGHYAQSVDSLQKLLVLNDKSLEAYEWLSTVHRVTGRNIEAQTLLSSAAIKLPTAPSLYSSLGNVASENKQWDVASDAFRSAIGYAKHSFHQTQDNYFGLAQGLQTKLTANGDLASVKALEEAVRVLESVVEEYYDIDLIRFRSRLLTSESYQCTGDQQRANAAAKDAFTIYRQLDESEQAQEMDNLLEGLENTASYADAEAYKVEFNKQILVNTDWGKLNQQGMSYYRKGAFAEAFECFQQSVVTVKNPSTLLNLMQAGHELIKAQPENRQAILAVYNRYLLGLNIGALNKKQQLRYRNLSIKRAELLESIARG